MRFLFSASFILFALLCIVNVYFILFGAMWMQWIAALFLFALFLASVFFMISAPVGRSIGFAAFIVCLIMSALLWTNSNLTI